MANGDIGFSKLSAGMQTFLAILLIIGAVVPCVLGFVNLDKRVDDVETNQSVHEARDDKQWEKVWVEVDDSKDDINQLKLDTQKNAQYYMEIMRMLSELKKDNSGEFDRLNRKFDTLEIVE